MWVIDGYAVNIQKEDLSNLPYTYFHCVWGRNKGVNNGYFILKSGQIGGGVTIRDIDDSCDSVVYNKYTNLKYIINFKIDPASNGDITL